jgi:2-methylcitrate dehydratase PrpD
LLEKTSTGAVESIPDQQQSGATRALSEFLAALAFEDLPVEVVGAAKVLTLDLIGCALGAMKTEEVRIAMELGSELGGKEECSVFGQRFRTSCQHAAYLNSIASHVIELDDTHRDSITHVGAAVIPAALAMAEREAVSPRCGSAASSAWERAACSVRPRLQATCSLSASMRSMTPWASPACRPQD